MTYRIVYVSWLRPVMSLLVPNWAALTIGHTIIAGRDTLSAETIAHELVHVGQWDRYGVTFPFRYLWASVQAVREHKHWYWGNRFEVEAYGHAG